MLLIHDNHCHDSASINVVPSFVNCVLRVCKGGIEIRQDHAVVIILIAGWSMHREIIAWHGTLRSLYGPK